jgi:CheY-like chemotaxis protein
MRLSASMRIMIVDDNKNMRTLVRRVIGSVTRERIDLVECADGKEAVECYSASPSDLVVMDIAMPHKDGIAAAEAITARDRSAKIIFLTQHPVSEYRFLKEKQGVLAVISKEDVTELKNELKLFFPK